MIGSISYKLRRYKLRHSKFRHNRYWFNNFIKSKTGVVIILIGVIVIVGVIILFPHFIRHTYKVTVTNKQIIKRNNTNEYLIYTQTEDGKIKVFQDTNNFLELKLNSEDLYWAISINKKYEVKAYGFNIPLLLDYQNIVKVKGMLN